MTTSHRRSTRQLEFAAFASVSSTGERADLRNATLTGCDLREANLRGADLCNADLRRARLSGAILTGADATLADLSDADCSGACLCDCRLQAINKATRGASRTLFRGADCTRTTLKHSNLAGCDFSNAMMQRADLTRTDLRDAILTGADLSGADLSFSNLSGASLRHTSLVGAILSGCTLDDADLRGADLTMATLNGVRCVGTHFGASLWSKTVVARASGLHAAFGLDALRFGDPSSMDLWTLRASAASFPPDLMDHVGAGADVLRRAPLHAASER